MRIGTGYDVHQLQEGLPLWIGGERIEHTHGLLGHSDADLLLHAICDAFGVRMLDFRRDFLDRAGRPRPELYLDGLHPGREGHRVMAERVVRVLSVMERERMNA